MRNAGIGYALLCIVTPMAWGLVVVWVSNFVERKVRRSAKGDEVPPIDYHI
jgi:hypothetical protein